MKRVLHSFKHGQYLLALLAVMLCGEMTLAQSAKITIRGVVKDARDRMPIPGAVIRISGTTASTATDGKGAYEIVATINGTAVVTISYTGYSPYSKTITDNVRNVTINADLAEGALNLNEIVVTGTAIATSKRELGNAISTLSAKDLQSATATSVDQAMAGKISGAQISQNSGNAAGGISVRLRGNSTIAGSSDPLYIVDGVIINNSSDQLIDLGGYTQNRLVDINPSDIDRIEIIKGAAGAAIYGSRASNGVVQIFTKKGKSGQAVISVSTQFRNNSIRKKLDYNHYPFRFTNTTAGDLSQVPVQRYDLQDMIFQSAYGTENNISVSGGSDNTQYYLSGGFLGNQGIIGGTNFHRASTRLRLDHRFNDWIKASMGFNYSLSSSREIPNGGLVEAYGALTGFIFANNFIDPNANSVTGIYPSLAPTGLLRTNPLEAINRFDFKQQTSRFIGDFQLTITPFKKMTINYTLGYDNSTQLATGFIPVGNTTPSYATGYSRRADRIGLLLNNDLTASYKTKIGSAIESSTSLGATAQTERVNSASITATQLNPVSQVASSGATVVPLEARSTMNILGFFAQQTFGYKDKIYITGAIRNDVSSIFGANNRWQYYPKLSGTYILSEEGFWKNSSLASNIPTLKLRASYGQSGNLTAIGAYDRLTNYTNVSLPGLPGSGGPPQLGNPDIKPERQIEKEIGLDASFLNDRLGFEVTYYNKDVKDLLLLSTLRPSTGYLTQIQNIGTMTNKGIEVLLRAVPVQSSNFKWNSTLIFSANKNKVDNVPGGLVTFPGGFGQVAAVDGYALGAFYATYFARNADGSLLLNPAGFPQTEKIGRDANGQPLGSNRLKVIGDPNPDWTGSFTNEFFIGKSFSLRMQWDASYGNDVFNFTRRVGERDIYGGLAGYEAELKGEVPKGTSAATYSIFEKFIEDGSYLKLRELSASYDLKLKLLNDKPLRITVSGRNLLSIDNYSGWDPETNAAGQSTGVRGFDFTEVPIPRTFALGLNYTF
ncbi:SusC/RagA family TonB-linked outer membrane protein [Pedobacter heparinus]|uniref:SusC/RagA family TonB-linked outer membrane protein n=1 Tax=Pedobacter heparinus TaxID=984 RepID=UPI00292E051B|nr:SusC/RagA family TonB-linked outer membrane protein [Pedobacter heparinus]